MGGDARFVLGVDGGGTRTRVALVGVDGAVLGLGEAGCGNVHDVGADGVREQLREARELAAQAAGRAVAPAAAAFLGMAGAGSEAERGVLRGIALELELAPEATLAVDHDLRIALAAGLGGEPGIVLVAGTGSACYGRAADGRSARAGGYGSFLDDGGSAFDLGRRALRAAVRAEDGRGPATILGESIRRQLGVEGLRELLGLVDVRGSGRSRVAGLAPVVGEAAGQGDAVAVGIVEEAVAEAATAVAAVAHELEQERPHVALCGGLVGAGSWYRAPLESAILERVPAATIVEARLPAVFGAVQLALESLGRPPTAAVRRRWLGTVPMGMGGDSVGWEA